METIVPKCRWCSSTSNPHRELLRTGHTVCLDCFKTKLTWYELVPQSQVAGLYGINAAELKSAVDHSKICAIEKPNPRGYKPSMKLYYRFQLVDLCCEKWGSVAAFKNEKEARALKRKGLVPMASEQKRRKMDEPSAPPAEVCSHELWSSPERVSMSEDEDLIRFRRKCENCNLVEEWEEL